MSSCISDNVLRSVPARQRLRCGLALGGVSGAQDLARGWFAEGAVGRRASAARGEGRSAKLHNDGARPFSNSRIGRRAQNNMRIVLGVLVYKCLHPIQPRRERSSWLGRGRFHVAPLCFCLCPCLASRLSQLFMASCARVLRVFSTCD